LSCRSKWFFMTKSCCARAKSNWALIFSDMSKSTYRAGTFGCKGSTQFLTVAAREMSATITLASYVAAFTIYKLKPWALSKYLS
jgi:hypothetical protein